MKRRNFLISLVTVAALGMLTNHTTIPYTAEKPNIIYIMMDEWGYFEWSGMGHPILQTPNIDKLASEGIRFTQFLAGGNVCAPTRSALMTGQHTGHTTVRSNGGGLALCAKDITIANILKDAGYVTGGFGKWGLGDAGTTGVPENHGFDTFFGYYHQVHAHTYYPRYLIHNSRKVALEKNTGDYLTGKTFSHKLIHAKGLEFIRENKDHPFFAYLPWTPPHGYWAMPEDDPAWLKYKDKQWDASNQKGEYDAQMYAAMVEMVDRQIGEIMALLKELNIDNNTIVFVCGDNGGQAYFKNNKHPHGFFAPNVDPKTGKRFRGGKGNFYEGGLRIPFMVRWPGKIQEGTVSDHLGYFPDIMPTLAELAGIEPPTNTDGISILPTLLGEEPTHSKAEHHEYLYWEDPNSCAVRKSNWKAIKPAREASFELYDLSKDLEELHDVADQYPEILEKMISYAKAAHTPPCKGKVLDASMGFKGHKNDISGDTSDQRTSISKLIGKHKVIFTEPPKKIPVPHSIDAPMLGNGFTGVAISGPPEKQVYHFARNDFWRLKSSLNQSFPAVLGKLEIEFPELENATYQIKQDLYTAATYSGFKKGGQQVRFKSYVSADEDLLVIELSTRGAGELKGSVNLKLPGPDEFVNKPPMDLIYPAETEQGKTLDGIQYISRGFEAEVDIPTKAAIALKVIGNKANNFMLSADNPFTIVVALSSNFKSDDCVKTAIDRVAAIKHSDLEEIEYKHENWWSTFWSKSFVDISDSLIEKQYYLSNYGMASFSRDPDFPPSIFGTCITKERPSWNGDYHLNYNHFAPYYGLFSSNHIEQAIPCNIPILAQQERGEYYSEKVCGIKGGIMLPVGVGPMGIETTRRNELMEKHRAQWIEEGSVQDEGLFYGQKSNSSYCVVNMAQHFYSTYDTGYIKMYYPFVKGVASFWEHYLTFEDGRYVIYNDAIHEGTIGTMNPILSLGLVRLVIQTAIDMSKELEVDSDRTKKWQHILIHLSDYTYQKRDGKKVFRYTEKGTAWWGDNTLGIQHIYPGGQIGLDSDPELLQVAHNTIDVMQRWIDFNGSNSFFPAAVRVAYDPAIILDQMHNYCINTYPNGFQLNNPHGIENLSTVPNTINEMLCMGHGGVLRVFPVWPKNKDARFFQLRVHGAFLVSSELKDERVQYIEVLSEKGKTLELLNPWDKKVEVMRPGSKKELIEGKRLQIGTSVGERILIRQKK